VRFLALYSGRNAKTKRTIHRTHGARAGPTEYAPRRIVMVVREGSGWVLLRDGTRENLTATNVVARDPGGGGYLLPGSALTLGRIGQQPRAGRDHV